MTESNQPTTTPKPQPETQSDPGLSLASKTGGALSTLGTKQARIRQDIAAWIESQKIQNLIIGLIVFNAIALGLETSPSLAHQ